MDSDMTPDPARREEPKARQAKGQVLGAGIAIGAGGGAAMLDATGIASWIGVGAGAGVAIGPAVAGPKKRPGE